MSKVDVSFHALCNEILTNGKEYNNVNRGVKRLQIPSHTFRHEFKDGFPAITNKKLYWHGIVGELLWFLRGDNNVKFLNEHSIKIWNKDAYNWYNKNFKEGSGKFRRLTFEEFEQIGHGSVGQNYSVQWRAFNGKIDQIKNLIEGMANDIMSSRLKVNAWNPSELDMTALPPCHDGFQIIGVPLENGSFGFELHWNQRSVDVFLGLPFNIASYGLLAKILEDMTGCKALAIEGSLKCVHFYDNQYDAVRELLSRDPNKHPNCELNTSEFSRGGGMHGFDLDEYLFECQIDHFKLIGYTSDEAIKVEMLAPKE